MKAVLFLVFTFVGSIAFSHDFCIAKREDTATYFYADAQQKIVCLKSTGDINKLDNVTTRFWALIPLLHNWFGQSQNDLDTYMKEANYNFVGEFVIMPFKETRDYPDRDQPLQIYASAANPAKASYCVVGKKTERLGGLDGKSPTYDNVSIHCPDEQEHWYPTYAQAVPVAEYRSHLNSLGYTLAFDSAYKTNAAKSIVKHWEFEVFVK